MNELNDVVKNFRNKNPKKKNPREFIRWWVEKDRLDGEIVDAFVMILRTCGCAWAHKGGCSMCGYINDAVKGRIREEDILFQFTEIMKNFSGQKIVKLYTSGSFLDDNEIPRTAQDKILEILMDNTDKIIFETRPEFISEKRLKGLRNLEIAIGLESANDFVLENSINKGFKFKDYLKAVKILKEMDIDVKTYLLIKPPFLSENEAIKDALRSAEKVASYSSTISFNPVNIQRFTLVEKLWKKREYRTPWLWSVVEVLRKSSKLKNTRLMSHPTAGGTQRGAHNCGKCDAEVLRGIEKFSLTQDIKYFEELNCDCRKDWQGILMAENFTKAQGDLYRLI